MSNKTRIQRVHELCSWHATAWQIVSNLPDKDICVPRRIKSNRHSSPQRNCNALRSIMQNRVDTSCSMHNMSSASSLSTFTKITQNQTWPVVIIKRVHLSWIFPAVKYLNVVDKFKKNVMSKHWKYLAYSDIGVDVPWGYSPQIKQRIHKV